MTFPRIKICCISSEKEAHLAISCGAHVLGLVADQPSGPAILKDDHIRQIVRAVPPGVSTFLLTSRTNAREISEHVDYCGTDSVQIVTHLDVMEHEKLERLMPSNIKRVQVIHIEDDSALELIDLYTPFSDAFLLDSGRPNAAVAEYGGTGRTHDWDISAEFVRRATLPVFLAGGLNAQNVGAAIEKVKPYGLDLCSCVRTNDMLDEKKLKNYFRAIHSTLVI